MAPVPSDPRASRRAGECSYQRAQVGSADANTPVCVAGRTRRRGGPRRGGGRVRRELERGLWGPVAQCCEHVAGRDDRHHAEQPAEGRAEHAAERRAGYIEGVSAVNGGAICNAMDANLEHKIIQEIVRARPSEAHSSCAQALTGLVAATTTPSERSGKLPTFRVTTTGNTAVVKYVGTHTHHPHTFTLVKQGPGWLIERSTKTARSTSGPRADAAGPGGVVLLWRGWASVRGRREAWIGRRWVGSETLEANWLCSQPRFSGGYGYCHHRP